MIRLSDAPILETERLVLRAPEAADWPVWRDFHVSARAEHIGGAGSAAQAWRAFGHFVGHWVLRGWGSFVFCAHDDPHEPLGAVGPWFPEGWPEREIGWTVWSPQAEGRGLAHEAARAAVSYAFEDLGWDTAVSYVAPGNARSVRLAERLGAVLDAGADGPHPDDLVFRHPAPAGAETADDLPDAPEPEAPGGPEAPEPRPGDDA